MVNPLSLKIICGSHSFPRDEDEEYNDHERAIRSADSSPRKSSRSSKGHSKNPYSTRGLDKFSALLAEMEEKRQRIYSEISPDKISFVQFDCSKDNTCRPIVVKAKTDQTQTKNQIKKSNKNDIVMRSGPLDEPHRRPLVRSRSDVGPTTRARERSLLKGMIENLQELRRPKYYLPLVVIVILIFLALFGRSVAIMCTSIGWYLIPTIANGDSKQRNNKSVKKKALVGHQGGITSFKGPL